MLDVGCIIEFNVSHFNAFISVAATIWSLLKINVNLKIQ